MISSRPPWRWGGNMDFNKLTAGATLYLPVFHDGRAILHRRLARGAGRRRGQRHRDRSLADRHVPVHRAQGRLAKSMFWPRAEDADFYYTMGMDLDLDVAMRNATQETVRY